MHDTATAGATPSRFNISRWALDHPALTRYLMVVLMVLGFAAYFQLGQDEDPPFTFRAMVVQAFWPGASAQQMAEQVTDKIEKALQEVPHADVIRSYAKPGESLTILQLKDSSPPKEVPNSWYQARKRVGDIRHTLPAGVVGPVFNDDFGDVYGSIFALRSPLIIGGTFKDPSFRPDFKRLGLRGATALVLASITPPAALLATIEVGPGEDSGCGGQYAK